MSEDSRLARSAEPELTGGGSSPAGEAMVPGWRVFLRRKPLNVFLVVTAIKLVFFAILVQTGAYRPFIGANAKDHYLPIADRMLTEGRFNGPDSRPDSKVPPGYPLLIAAFKAVSGGAFLQVVVFAQILMDLGVAWGILVLARLVSSERVGLIAGVCWLLYPPEVLVSTWITAETPFTGLLVLSVILLYLGMIRKSWVYTLAAGLALGMATLFRATCLYFPLLFLIARTATRGRRGLLEGLCLAAGTYALIFPWALRNYFVLDDRIVVSVGAGSVMLQGSDERFFTIGGKKTNYAAVFREAAERGLTKPGSDKESAIDGWMMKVGLHQYERRLNERPWSYVPFLLHKFVRLGYGTESGSRIPQLFLGLCSFVVISAAIWQIWCWRSSQPDAALLLGALVAYFILLHWLTLPEYRYMHPLFPFLGLAAVHRLVAWSERRSSHGPD